MFARKKMSENTAPVGMEGGMKKMDGPTKAIQGKAKRGVVGVGQGKRSALGNIANDVTKIPTVVKAKVTSKNATAVAAKVAVNKPTTAPAKKKVLTKKDADKEQIPPAPLKKGKPKAVPKEELDVNCIEIDTSCNESFGRAEEDISVIEEDDCLLAFDRENFDDVYHVAVYAQDIFSYLKLREKLFPIPSYLKTREHPITPAMRAILVDWMVEIQENFELNHETLYLGVKLTDLYLSRTMATKESLQLIGAVALFVASKFDEQRYPLIEDFTYVCDNAFDSQQFVEMEMALLKQVDFDLGIPISYRFLRRYAKVGKLSIQTLTLARYILEMSLMEADFISERDSLIAAAALYLAMKMRKEGVWTGDLVKASGYELPDFKQILVGLNSMLHAPTNPQLATVKLKYSHRVFHEVAKIPTISTRTLA